jgi:serine/threonine protein kinase
LLHLTCCASHAFACLNFNEEQAENLLLVDRSADWPKAKLIDFGFSTTLRYNLTGSFLGTGGYIAPEIRQQRSYSQVRGSANQSNSQGGATQGTTV